MTDGGISEADVAAAESELADAKASGDTERIKVAKQVVRDARQAWRSAEVAAGRRDAGHAVGGDAMRTD